jgi:hypothetical protein
MKIFYWFGIYLLLGIWMVASPYVMGFADHGAAYWNALACGGISLVVALAAVYYWREHAQEQGVLHRSAKAT